MNEISINDKECITLIKERHPRLYEICFKNERLKDSPHLLEKEFHKIGLCSGEIILCRFLIFLWSQNNPFELSQLNYLDESNRHLILNCINKLYNS